MAGLLPSNKGSKKTGRSSGGFSHAFEEAPEGSNLVRPSRVRSSDSRQSNFDQDLGNIDDVLGESDDARARNQELLAPLNEDASPSSTDSSSINKSPNTELGSSGAPGNRSAERFRDNRDRQNGPQRNTTRRTPSAGDVKSDNGMAGAAGKAAANTATKAGAAAASKVGTAAAGAGKAAGAASGAASGLSRAASAAGAFAKRFDLKTKDGRRRSGIAGTVATIILIITVLGSFTFVPLKLLHIANVMREATFGGNDHTNEHGTIAVVRRIMGRHLKPNDGRASNSGNYLKNRFINTRIDKFNVLLEKEGLRLKFDKPSLLGVPGRLLGIEDIRTGALVEDFSDRSFLSRRTAVKDLVFRTLASENVGAIRHGIYTWVMRFHAGVSFKFWTTEKAQSLKKLLVSKVRGGIASETVPESGPRQGTRDPNTEYSSNDKLAAAQEASDSAKAATDTFAETNDAVAAQKAGMDAFRSRALKLFGWTGLAVFYCIIHEMVEEAEKHGYQQRAEFLMREGNMVLTMADQMIAATSGGGFKLGTSDQVAIDPNDTTLNVPSVPTEDSRINIDQFGEMMERFDGVESADPKIDEEAKDFTQAAAWRRNTDEPVSTAHGTEKEYMSYTPDLDPAANPDSTQLKGALGAVAAVFQIPGSGPICAVLNSWFGWVLMGAEVVINIVDGDLIALAGKAATIAAFYLLQPHVQSFLNASTSLAVTGSENAVDLINNVDAGLDLSAKDEARTMGDRVATDAEVGQHRAAVRAEQETIARSKGWTYRLFALENTRSLASRILAKTPTSARGVVASIRSNLFSLPHNLGAIIFPARFAMADEPVTAYKNPYEFRGMVTTDAEIDNIDPEAAECFLVGPADQPTNYTDCPVATGDQKSRLSMLGNPNDYTPANGSTGNKADLMHCFVDKWRLPTETDDICLDLGILTKQGNENPKNPGKEQIVDKIYCQNNQVCGLGWTHTLPKFCDADPDTICGQSTPTTDFEIYRMYLKYTFISRSLEGFTVDTDPFAPTKPLTPGVNPGTGPAVALADMCKVGPGGAEVNNVQCAAYWAAKVLANPKIKRPNYVATTDLIRAAAGQPTSNASTCGRTSYLHYQLLYAIEQAATNGGFEITIWNFMTGHECDRFNHPNGRASDIGAINGKATDTPAGYPGNKAFSEYIAQYLPVGGEILQANQPNCHWTANLPSYISNGHSNDRCNHIHLSVGSQVKF